MTTRKTTEDTRETVNPNSKAERDLRLRMISAFAAALLLVEIWMTFPLWWGNHAYPVVPLLSGLQSIPNLVDQSLLIGLILCLLSILGAATFPKWLPIPPKISWLCLILLSVVLMLLSQQRIQAWLWHGIWMGVCFQQADRDKQWIGLKAITIAIYFYSAISKLDVAFVETHGATFLLALQTLIDQIVSIKIPTPTALALLFPLSELLIAIGLMIPRTQRIAGRLSLVMHASLIALLGPWGLNHHVPVLIWNTYFLMQNSILFAPILNEPRRSVRQLFDKPQLSTCLLIVSLCFPMLEWINRADVWPSWGLYAARGAKLQLFVDRSVLEEMPPAARQFAYQTTFGSDWVRIDLFRWSFEQTGSPAYPEDRFLLAVALSLVQELSDEEFTIVHQTTADRWSGQREETRLTTHQQYEEFAKNYLFNASVSR